MSEANEAAAESRRQRLLAIGVTDEDIRAVAATCPPLTDAQRAVIAEISQPILRRLRRKQGGGVGASADAPAQGYDPARIRALRDETREELLRENQDWLAISAPPPPYEQGPPSVPATEGDH
jgi:hypothetical protein